MIVLDINCFHSVFDSTSDDHAEFKPVLNWVNERKEKRECFVYGGTKYKKELSKATKYHKILNEYKNVGKCVEINTQLIDNDAIRLKAICSEGAFDDEHIVAILNISGCKLVCTKDSKSIPYLKKKELYSDRKAPRIYSSAKHKNLLRKEYMVVLKNKC